MGLYIDSAASAILADSYVGVNLVATRGLKRMAYRVLKRFSDIIGALFGMVLLIPMIIVVKIATVLSGDFHSIFFTQERIGKDGKIFKIYKFRSMVPDADKVLEKLLKEDKKIAAEYKKMRKIENDPRVTRIGRALRRSSMDELPQMINVLKGDMTFIGNRPYLPREKKDMGRYYEDIIKVKPGLSGFWQVSLRSRGTFKERLKMEEFYANNAGFRFDFEILLKTFGTIVGGDGAK